MPTIKLSTLLQNLCDIPISMDCDISGLSMDSRLVKPGDLFFACLGTHLDGRQFITKALQMGAHAVLAEQADLTHLNELIANESLNSKSIDNKLIDNKTIKSIDHKPTDNQLVNSKSTEDPRIFYVNNLNHLISEIAARFYNHPAKLLKIIGVTGTNGKTSCTYFIADALKQLQTRCGIIGTLGTGLYGNIQPGNLTTPDAITIQKILAEFVAQDAAYAAIEVSSHSLIQGRVDKVPFTVGIFTNLTRDHLDYHGSMEAYGAAKQKLFTELAPEHMVINADDAFGRKLIQTLAPHKKIYAYSIGMNNNMTAPNSISNSIDASLDPISPLISMVDLSDLLSLSDSIELINVDEVQLNHTGIHANVFTPWGKGELHAHLIGQFNLSNLLAVLTTLCLLDIPLPVVLNCLSDLQPVPGRMQTLGGKTKPLVVVDYSHTPDSLENALRALRGHCQHKLYCVFGCGGDRDRGKRPIMAKLAEQFADVVIVTDDNPRTENPQQIVRDIMQGFINSGTIVVQHDRAQAIRDVIKNAQAGDCILIAGKGAETYQQIGDIKIPFNDIEEVKKTLSEIK